MSAGSDVTPQAATRGGSWRRRLLGLDYRETSFERRRIECEERLRLRLEEVPARFLDGYHLALDVQEPGELSRRLDAAIPAEFRGFAHEGAGMGLALLDLLSPWGRSRTIDFATTAAAHHDYIVCVGAGFALARIPWARWRPRQFAARFPASLSGLAINGFGFHEAFFHHERIVRDRQAPGGLGPELLEHFDNGVGRALWFVAGANPDRLRATIEAFPVGRRPHLWAGLGLACAYAGFVFPDLEEYRRVLSRLRAHAGADWRRLALGASLAAETRRKAGNPAEWTDVACRSLADLPAVEAAGLVVEAQRAASRALEGRPDEEVRWRVHPLINDAVMGGLHQAPEDHVRR